MKDILEREDVHLLVSTFYSQVREDTILGPVFNTLIKEENWPEHIHRIADFWECNLLFRPTFKGNPLQTHRQVDADYQYRTNERHYERWVELWCQTVYQLFEGEKSQLAKLRAAKIGRQLLAKVNEGKPVVSHSS
jgi:hemoglobin